jgi:hypothetical protein
MNLRDFKRYWSQVLSYISTKVRISPEESIEVVVRVGSNYYKTKSVTYSMKFGSVIIEAYDNRRDK